MFWGRDGFEGGEWELAGVSIADYLIREVINTNFISLD